MTNAWLTHVKAFHSKNPQLTYKQALIGAKSSYKKQSGGGAGKTLDTNALANRGIDVAQELEGNLFKQLNSSTAESRRRLRQVQRAMKRGMSYDQAIRLL